MRCTSRGSFVAARTARTMTGPSVMLGTKRPSMTSTWMTSAPAASTARTSSARRPKSAARIDGAILTFMSAPSYQPRGEKRVGVVAVGPGPDEAGRVDQAGPRHSIHGQGRLDAKLGVRAHEGRDDVLALEALEGTDRVDEHAAGA